MHLIISFKGKKLWTLDIADNRTLLDLKIKLLIIMIWEIKR